MISKEQIKQLRSLKNKKFRNLYNLYLVEGPKLLAEALENNAEIEHIYYTPEKADVVPQGIANTEISDKVLKQISLLNHPQGVVFTVKKDNNDRKIDDTFLLALDNIQDPGNMGTILRLAAWYNIKTLLLSSDCVDIYNPKVVQASMGAVFHTNCIYTDLKAHLSQTELPVFGALLSGENLYETKLQKKGIILLGNEGHGIDNTLIPFITTPINIPKFGKGESLNVAMAAGIIISAFHQN